MTKKSIFVCSILFTSCLFESNEKPTLIPGTYQNSYLLTGPSLSRIYKKWIISDNNKIEVQEEWYGGYFKRETGTFQLSADSLNIKVEMQGDSSSNALLSANQAILTAVKTPYSDSYRIRNVTSSSFDVSEITDLALGWSLVGYSWITYTRK